MSTPCIIARKNPDGSIDAIAVRYDGSPICAGVIIRKLQKEHLDQILQCPYDEIMALVTEKDIKNNDTSNYERIGRTKFFMRFYPKGEPIERLHKTKQNTKFLNMDDLLKNGGFLEDWYALYVYTEDGWMYKNWDDTKFRKL